MKKYLSAAGYKYIADQDDMTNKQFTLVSTEYLQSEQTVLGNVVMDRVENYELFLKDFDPATFKTKLEGIINSAFSDKVFVGNESTFNVEQVENGYNITLTFNIKG